MTQFPDRVEHHSEKPEGVSAQVETTDEVRVTTAEHDLRHGSPDEAQGGSALHSRQGATTSTT